MFVAVGSHDPMTVNHTQVSIIAQMILDMKKAPGSGAPGASRHARHSFEVATTRPLSAP